MGVVAASEAGTAKLSGGDSMCCGVELKYRARVGRNVGGSAEDGIRVSKMDRLIVLLSMVMVEMLRAENNCWRSEVEMCCLKTIGISFWMTKPDKGHAKQPSFIGGYRTQTQSTTTTIPDCPSCLSMNGKDKNMLGEEGSWEDPDEKGSRRTISGTSSLQRRSELLSISSHECTMLS